MTVKSIMRHAAFLALVLATPMAFAGASTYDGYDLGGRSVSVWSSNGYTHMTGSFNVRYRPAPGHENSYMSMSHDSSYETVGFSGRDADNEYFYCYAEAGTNDYDEALGVLYGGLDGLRISVQKSPGSSACTYINITKSSQYQQ
jgi:hypothetical protein